MRIDVVTLFPELVEHASRFGVTGRALERGLWQLATWNPRNFTTDNYRTVDDRPYGGGPGMVMLAEPLSRTVSAARAAQREAGYAATRTIHLSPSGVPLTHRRVAELAAAPATAYVLVAGRYEGIDERFIAREVDEEIAIGDFVVSGGELPALMLIDAVVRQRPGVLNDAESAAQDSFVAGLLDCPHYTRPERLEGPGGERVPEVLMSGHHEDIRRWRLMQSLGRTKERRPALLEGRTLTREETELLAAYGREAQEQQQ
jgi:tRNA (guanine37-N1)-methyltransferase